MKSHDINNEMLGLAGWYIDKDVCKNIIDIFENRSVDHTPGVVGLDIVDKEQKDSIDLNFSDYINQEPYFVKYLQELSNVVEEYKKLYIGCDIHQHEWGITERINIQKYNPGGGFKTWHSERKGGSLMVQRHLVFMTYLNDVSDQGETEWLYQKTKIKPQQGLTVVWSADWFFTHRGIPSPSQTKYIVTGWFSYLSG